MGKRKSGAGRPIEAKAPWGELATNVGGVVKLAEKLGVTHSTLNKWKLGTHRIPALALKELIRLCRYYEITDGVDSLQSDSP